jgi:adenylate cyclase
MDLIFCPREDKSLIYMFRIFLINIALFFGINACAQSNNNHDRAWEDSILNLIRTDQTIDSKTKCELTDTLFQVAGSHHDTCAQVYARILKSAQLDKLGLTDSALIQLYWANQRYSKKCDSLILMALFANFTNVYLSLNEFDRLDSIFSISMKLWDPQWTDKEMRFAILNNKAIADISRNDTASAGSLFHQILSEARLAGNKNYIKQSLMNLGGIKGMLGDLDSSYYYLNEAARLTRSSPDIDDYLVILINLANLDMELGRYPSAKLKLDSAFTLSSKWDRLKTQADVQHSRAVLYSRTKDFKKAYEYFISYDTLQGKYLDEERVKAVTEMMEKYESEKKARQIQQLKIENLDAALKNERITKTRNHFIYIGSGILLVALGLWWRLTFVHKSRAAIKAEKEISESLLLNILPASVAEELKIKGKAEAKHFPLATILFSDFKSFTTISESLSAEDLVSELNVCFKEFDDIMTRHGLEKIKTIGDAYMAAAAVPATNAATALEVVLAGIEMQRFILARKAERDQQNLVGFEMRVGIHSGPVVAGIVGVKKFQYDVWGDTVNIANRMETNSDVGRVNISEATYQLIKDDPRLKFTSRGLIQAKGKGEMTMYFVDLAA